MDMWRYSPALPLVDGEQPVSLGEGTTPLVELPGLASEVGVRRLWVKDEAVNPTASFKARGLSAAVTRARSHSVPGLVVPTAGNAGAALAAYGAAAGVPVRVYAPATTPAPILDTIRAVGADLQLIDGHIGDAGKAATAFASSDGHYNVATLREPYRAEGNKTLGYELAEQLEWRLPDVIVYPTGGGEGLIGMWKAFDEMERMDWIGSKRPRMVTVQAAGCAPIVRAFEEGNRFADEFPNAATTASGLRVPKAIGDFLILDALHESGGTAVAVTDEELIAATLEIGALEGVFCAPEGAACLPALRQLIETGEVNKDDVVVLFNTGSGVKYMETFVGADRKKRILEDSA